MGVIDPGDLIEETDEEDNRPLADNKDQTMPVVQVDNQYRDTPNLILEEILVEVPHFELKATDPVEVDSCGKEVPVEEDQLNPHVKVTAILNASGKYWPDFPDGAPMPIPRVDLRATLLTPGIDEVPDIPIQIFNNDADNPAYGPKLKIRDLEPGTPMSVSLEMRLDIPDIFLQNLVDTIATKSAACFGTCDLDEACFTKEMVSGAVCDGEDFMYCGGVIDNSDPQNPVPIIANLDWGCYMNRIDGECLDQCDPDLDCMLGCTEDLVSLEVRVEAYDDYSEEMGQPISFSAWGLIGAEIYMGVTVENCGPLSFEAHTGPWANLGTQVTAGVGTGALSAGVGGALDPLLEDTFFATVSVLDLRVEENTLRGELHEDITNTLTGPQGRVFFYVSYPCIKFCKKWGIPYPCGFKACQAKKNIVGFTTFEREDVLFCEEQPFVGSIQ